MFDQKQVIDVGLIYLKFIEVAKNPTFVPNL
jgi:hypothetical protein